MTTFDHHASVAVHSAWPPTASDPSDASMLASGLVDVCTQRFASAALLKDDRGKERRKKEARECYQKRTAAIKTLALPGELRLDDACGMCQPGWLAIDVEFVLETPWYSKDDRPFHVLDNPLRKDGVFGVPVMSSTSWKGLLRWACRMEHGLMDHLAQHGGKTDDPPDPGWIIHLFGNQKSVETAFAAAALHCFPTWFDRIAFEVINPHDRTRRAGTQPIYYEVVPAGTTGTLRLLYAPIVGHADEKKGSKAAILARLLDATEKLLTTYGFSAKRTAGWGLASIRRWQVRLKDRQHAGDLATIQAVLPGLLAEPGGGA